MNRLLRCVNKSDDVDRTDGFDNAEDALAFTANNPFDVAFLDIELSGTDGITLAEKLREQNPDCGIVYCTGFRQYAIEAINRHVVDGYLLKPVEAEDVQKQLNHYKSGHFKSCLLTAKANGSKLTFSDRNGNLLAFRRRKT